MKRIRLLYSLLVLVLVSLLVLCGIWIPEALIQRKERSLSAGKTMVMDKQEVTPYTYTGSASTRIAKLVDCVEQKISYPDTFYGDADPVREPLDTELSEGQAKTKTEEFLLTLNEKLAAWGLDPWDLSLPASSQSTDGNTQYDGGAADSMSVSKDNFLYETITAEFMVDEADQQISAWLCYASLSDRYVALMLDAVTGIPVCLQYTPYTAADTEEEIEANAFTDTYGELYDENFDVPIKAKATRGRDAFVPDTVYISTGANWQLEYQNAVSVSTMVAADVYIATHTVYVWLYERQN